jgi:hypothetical protein
MNETTSGRAADGPRSAERRSFLAAAALGGAAAALGMVCINGSRRSDADSGTQPLLQSTLDSLTPGQQFSLPKGTYRHDDVLVVRVPGVSINGNGAELTATNEAKSAFYIRADGVSISNMVFSVQNTTKRWEGLDQHKITIVGASGTRLLDVQVHGSAAAGIFVGEGSNAFLLDQAVVIGTRADGIHMTGGAHDGVVVGARIDRSGDDGVAVVSYEKDSDTCRGIRIESPFVANQTWGRGVAVVGGDDISVSNVRLIGSSSAGIYVGVEGAPYFTRSTSNVRIAGGNVSGANRTREVQQGAIVVYSGRPNLSVDNVDISDISIAETRPDSPRQVSVLVQDGGSASQIRFDRITIDSPNPAPFFTNAAPDTATLSGWVVAGAPYKAS